QDQFERRPMVLFMGLAKGLLAVAHVFVIDPPGPAAGTFFVPGDSEIPVDNQPQDQQSAERSEDNPLRQRTRRNPHGRTLEEREVVSPHPARQTCGLSENPDRAELLSSLPGTPTAPGGGAVLSPGLASGPHWPSTRAPASRGPVWRR